MSMGKAGRGEALAGIEGTCGGTEFYSKSRGWEI